jgi:hypothetical protein
MNRFGVLVLAGAASFSGWTSANATDIAVPKAAPALVPPISGYVSLYGGGGPASLKTFLDVRDTLFAYGGDGRMNIWLSPAVSIQIDAEAEGTSSFDVSSFKLGGRISGIFGGHLAWRNAHAYALGAFGAVAGSNQFIFAGSSTYGLAGIEAQGYLGNFTLYPQAGYVGRLSGPDNAVVDFCPGNGWFGRLQGRHFLTPNDKLAAEIGWARLKHDLGPGVSGEYRILNWGISYEHRFEASPWALFVEYAGYETRTSGWPGALGSLVNGGKVTENLALIGVRAHFGDATLLAQDRIGATFDMPKFTRALPWACFVACVD